MRILIAATAATIAASLTVLAVAPAGAAKAKANPHIECLRLAESDPEAGLKRAHMWSVEDNGFAPRHCAAIALHNLGQYREAGTIFDRLVQNPSITDRGQRADLMRESAQAWLLAGDYKRAALMLSDALRLQPGDAATLIDRGLVLARAGDLQNALRDFDAAVSADPRSPEPYVLRGSIRRRLEQTVAAMADQEKALSLKRDHPDALLERGLLYRALGKPELAREDWRRVESVAPDSPAAHASREYLERLDAGEGHP